jgi:hypothetical protein
MSLIRFKFSLVLLLLCTACYSLKAQQITVRGVLSDKNTSLRVADAGIYNKANRLLSKSNMFGEFSISANLGDSISISKEGYTQYYLHVFSSGDLIIILTPVIQLSEVRITSQTKKQELDEIKKQYRGKGSFYAGKPPVLSYIFSPLTALYELVGKTPGQARRFNKFYYRELEQEEINRRFNSYTIKKYSELDGKDLQNFMDNYRPEYLQLAGWDEYQLGIYIKNSAKKYIDEGKPASKLVLPTLPKAPDLRVDIKEKN